MCWLKVATGPERSFGVRQCGVLTQRLRPHGEAKC